MVFVPEVMSERIAAAEELAVPFKPVEVLFPVSVRTSAVVFVIS